MGVAEAKNNNDNSTSNPRSEMKPEDKLIHEARAAVQAAAAAERKSAEGVGGNSGSTSAGGEKHSSSESKAGLSKLKARPAWALTEDTAAVCRCCVLTVNGTLIYT